MARLCHDLGCLRTQENIPITKIYIQIFIPNADAALFTIHPYLLDLPPFLISRLQLISGSTKERMRETRAGKHSNSSSHLYTHRCMGKDVRDVSWRPQTWSQKRFGLKGHNNLWKNLPMVFFSSYLLINCTKSDILLWGIIDVINFQKITN